MREASGEPLLPARTGTNARRVKGCYLSRREIRDATGIVDVTKVAGAKAVQGYCSLGPEGADKGGFLKVKKEEEFVPQDGPADIAAELILDQVIAGNDRARIVA